MYINSNGSELRLSADTVNIVWSSGVNGVRLGTALNDLFNGQTNDTMRGGAGDDTYYLWNSTSTIVEIAGDGVDTVVAKYWGAVTLPDFVENLVLGSAGSTAGTGNRLDNVIMAGTVGATLNGMGGNDVLIGGRGADLFRVQANNGSDTIIGFESGKDSIQLQNYGFSKFGQIVSAATQIGADTSIALGNGETLLLRGVQLSNLIAADFGFQADPAPIAAGFSAMSGAGRANTFNGWTVHNNIWNPGTLKDGVDYTINSSYNRADMTGGTTFNWSMPYVTEAFSTIRGFPEVMFGVPPKGNYWGNPTDKANTFPISLDKLHGLTADFDVTIGGTTSGFNVAYEMWLTSVPNGDRSTLTHEIMVWVHQGEVMPYGKQIGTYFDGDFTAKIFHTGTYIAFIADKDMLSGTLDMAKIIDKLKDMGIVSGKEYLAAIELGAELVSGTGSMTIHNLDLNVETVAPNGNIVVKHVTGAGTSVTEMPEFALDYRAGTEKLFNDIGVQIGTSVTTIDTDGVSIRHLDQQGRTTEVHVLKAAADGGVVTEKFDAANQFIGSSTVTKAADGSATTRFFDAQGNYTGLDIARVGVDGRDWILHHDATGKLLGAEKLIVESATTQTTQYFDANWSMTSADKVIKAGNTTTVQHFDAKFNIVSAEKSTVAADGTVTTQHFDGKWAITAVEIARTDANGVTVETQYNGRYQVVQTELTGTVGADTITGTAGTNEFHGGFGSDVLKAGAGVDNFYFDTAIGTDVDRILGFNAAKDTMFLDRDVFTGMKAGTLAASSFVNGATAKDADDRILYDKASGKIWFDADGSGSSKAVLFAQVDPNTQLSAADFVIF